ncbi:MAG TPA: glycerol-3-phosphate dehydrogenase/oxidase [Rhizomicrobium sp.]|nr:glycerol-3-phosphate dehydrogenase/oxidase [Rhizomicrobium sp.]
MRRALKRLADEEFDLLIIGGGITGASVARDAALRGLKVALIEKNDFANATSAHNSKLAHGGLRYLRNFELGLVRESLKERRIWQRIAPHLVHPLPFLVPMYKAGLKGRATLAAGLTLYDMLSYDRGWLDDPEQRLPGHSWLNAKTALAREPVLEGDGFEGSFLYYDAQMYSPERLALEHLVDAEAHGAALANYVEACTLLMHKGRVAGASARCVFSGEFMDINARVTLVAAGPWADIFLAHASGKPASHKLLRSKGIHVVVPAMTRKYAVTVAAGGGHFFVLPWRGHTILGTTDTAFQDAPDDVGVSERDVDDFLDFVNKYLPSANLKRSDVEYFYAGLRPLVDDGSGDTYGASRRAELVDHSKGDGLDGLFSAIGGKWTTSRDLAESVVDTLIAKLGAHAPASSTATTPMPGAKFGRFRAFAEQIAGEYPMLGAPAHLAQLYGSNLPAMLSEANNRPELLEPLGDTGDIGAQVLYAVREEMALTLDDVVMRRTGIGQLGRPSATTLDQAAAIMGAELGWNDERKQREVASLAARFNLQAATA